MATLEKYRDKGIGRALINAGREFVKNNKGEIIWCNARESAVLFYKKCGFIVISEKFDIENIGPHYVMIEKLL